MSNRSAAQEKLRATVQRVIDEVALLHRSRLDRELLRRMREQVQAEEALDGCRRAAEAGDVEVALRAAVRLAFVLGLRYERDELNRAKGEGRDGALRNEIEKLAWVARSPDGAARELAKKYGQKESSVKRLIVRRRQEVAQELAAFGLKRGE